MIAGLKEYNGNEMLQKTGHPAEKPEFTPASQLDPGPSRFSVAKRACGSLSPGQTAHDSR